MVFFRKKENIPDVDFAHLPRHIAIIMDGNGRWAKRRGLPRTAGHAAGSENFRTIATYCKEIGLDYLTVYAFSTENWKRPAEEVAAIMDLLKKYLLEAIGRMERDKVKMKFFGDLSVLDDELRRLFAADCVEGKADPNHLTEGAFAGYLFSAGVPDPDLIIRPSGELRLSNFLPWQSAYAEFYFTDVLWPDFSKKELRKAIAEYQHRSRRYGGV